MSRKIFILDTNVYLTNHNCLFEYSKNDIIIPLKVLDEIDKHKKRQDLVGFEARNTIRFLDSLREKGNLFKGVRLVKRGGLLKVKSYNPFALPDDLDLEDADNQIIATALSVKEEYPNKKVILVSLDINMRVKCDALGILTENYYIDSVLPSPEAIFSGVREFDVADDTIDEVYSGNFDSLDSEKLNVYPNEFIFLKSVVDEKRTIFLKKDNASIIRKCLSNNCWGLSPRNKEQLLSLDLLMNKDIPLVTLVGKAGSGKTLLALAAALEQTINSNYYDRIIVTKPLQPVGKDIGYLPGSMEEKMSPWIAPIKDNLNFLFKNDKMTLQMYFDNGQIEVEAMTFIRGRSITNSFIIIDEAQNLTQHEIKTILTRVGEGTKIILTGDIDQIDNVFINSTTNGLTYVVEKFKDQKIAGHMTLTKGERSEVATISANIL